MATPITLNGPTLEPGRPAALFRTRILGGGTDLTAGVNYNVARDGRFLINTVLDAPGAGARRPPVTTSSPAGQAPRGAASVTDLERASPLRLRIPTITPALSISEDLSDRLLQVAGSRGPLLPRGPHTDSSLSDFMRQTSNQ